MEVKILRDLYCFQYSLQFHKRSIYNTHQLIVHKYKEKKGFQAEIKIEPEETEFSHDLKSNLRFSIGNQDLVAKSSKQNTVNYQKKAEA